MNIVTETTYKILAKLKYWDLDQVAIIALNIKGISLEQFIRNNKNQYSEFVQTFSTHSSELYVGSPYGDRPLYGSIKTIKWLERMDYNIDQNFKNAVFKYNDTIDNEALLVQENEKLKSKVKSLEAKIKDKPINSKERRSFLILIYSEVVVKRKFDSQKQKNACTGIIKSDIEKNGFKIDDETLLNMLREASNIKNEL